MRRANSGLWLAPHGQSNEQVARSSEAFLWKPDGSSASSTWEGTYLIDPSVPAAHEYLRELFTRLRGLGYSYFKIDGQPVEKGSIAVIPEKGPTAGAEIKGGSYQIPVETGPVLGKSRVEIKATHKTGKQIEAGSPFPPGTMTDEIVLLEFKNEDSLTVDVKSGENEKDFSLTSPAKK